MNRNATLAVRIGVKMFQAVVLCSIMALIMFAGSIETASGAKHPYDGYPQCQRYTATSQACVVGR